MIVEEGLEIPTEDEVRALLAAGGVGRLGWSVLAVIARESVRT